MKKIVAGLLILILSACNSSDNSSETPVSLKEKAMNDLKGYKIVFASPHGNVMENNSDIWIMNPDGSDPKNLTPGTDGNDLYPEWGPGAHYIYYTSTAHKGAYELYRVNVNGKEPPEQLTNLEREVRSISVSADNTRIALGVMSGDSSGAEELSGFSADLYLLEMDTMEEALEDNTLVTMDDLSVLLSAPQAAHIWFEQPCWEPSQDQSPPFIAYSRTVGYDTDDETESVWIIRADGSGNRRITEEDSMPRWI